MKLKRVKIFGFKTFAEKTEFDLDGNIIAVVGPNGCGKSNIVDSILWGLGETSSKHLRAQTSQEVIFSGSANRKPVGFAEVTLLFDNEDGILPLDSPEVSVTRKLTRGGDSSFAINKRNCRLKDIGDLLADSGLGRAGYAIVGQSEIDQALAASAGQRRAWIDEAAGVQRYRARRVEAIRRLASAEEHLERVADIIREIESQREPLREEAEVAQKYKITLASLREIEVGLLTLDLANAMAELEASDERTNTAISLATKELQRAEELEDKSKEESDKVAELELKIEQIRDQKLKAQTALEQANAAIQIAQGKLESLDMLESRLNEESEASEERQALAASDFEKAKLEEAEERQNHTSLRESLGSADSEAKRLSQELSAAETELKKARELVAERSRLDLEAAHRHERMSQIEEELLGIADTIPDLEEAVNEANSQFQELEERINAAKTEMREAQEQLKQLQLTTDQVGAQSRKILSEIAALDGRRRGIEATIDAHEGLAQGPRAVMAAAAQGRLTASYKPVGEVIEVESDLALAIDTALGGSANDLIVPDERAAKDAIEFLKSNRLGRATFQPLTLMRPQTQTEDLRQLLRTKGVVGLASELVDCDRDARPVIDSLLGRIVIVETIDDGLKLAKTRGWSRLVTMDGEVIHSSGAVTGGASKHQSQGMVQRRAELQDLEEDIINLQKDLDELAKSDSSKQESREKLRIKIEACQESIRSQQQEHEETKSWLMGVQHELQTTLKSQARLKAELENLNKTTDLPKLNIDITKLEAARDELMKALAARSSDAEQANLRMEEADQRLNQAIARRQEAERRLTSILEAEKLRERRSGSLEPERDRFRAQLSQAEKDKESFAAQLEATNLEQATALEAKKNHLAEAVKLAEEAKQAHKNASSFSDTVHQAEIARAKADSKRTTATERLLEEYGITPEEALESAPNILLPDDAASAAAKFRREIKAMGDVNVGAIEAYERLTQRHEELTFQAEDILNGKVEIEAGIKELDRLTRERFLTTFEELRIQFAQMFQRIFNGGEGILELEDNANILDSGVEISVTIPGKKRQRLELLSGGERALSALAFLFALLKVKPSPLVILDEVDAPLDGRNVERFISMMREFSGQTQFILITHNPVTIESADVWFGVTMQEPGVSTVVPFKVPGGGSPEAPAHSVSLKG